MDPMGLHGEGGIYPRADGRLQVSITMLDGRRIWRYVPKDRDAKRQRKRADEILDPAPGLARVRKDLLGGRRILRSAEKNDRRIRPLEQKLDQLAHAGFCAKTSAVAGRRARWLSR